MKIPPGSGGFRRYAALETIPGRRHPILLTPNNPGPSFEWILIAAPMIRSVMPLYSSAPTAPSA